MGRSDYDESGAGPSVPGSFVPRKRSGVLELDLGDGVILYDDASTLVHHLSPSASVIWQLCQGDASVETLATEVAEELGHERAQVLADITALVAELDALGLVEDATMAPVRA